MNYGLYLSAAGMLTNMYRQDVAANNLANAQTPAFKRDLALLRVFLGFLGVAGSPGQTRTE